MREVIAGADDGDERCRLSFDAYMHRLVAGIAAMAAAMAGLDAIVFTGGVGENSPRGRAAAAEGVGFLGLGFDPAANDEADPDARLSAAGAKVAAVLVHAREDVEIANQVRVALAEL